MMEWKLEMTDQAENDMRGIYGYVSDVLLESGVAGKLLNRLIGRIREVKKNPKIYPLYPNEPWRSMGIRRVNEGKYAILLLPVDSKNTIYITNVMYGGRNIDQILEESAGDYESMLK